MNQKRYQFNPKSKVVNKKLSQKELTDFAVQTDPQKTSLNFSYQTAYQL